MCGISGCRLNRPLTGQDIALLRAMRDGVAHRGPDGAGEYIDAGQGVYFGHRRLSIIDTDSRSNQPMQAGQAVIAYNGELYNYKELRALLPPGDFRTEGDTEVVLQAWRNWGAKALHQFDGMFAFALLDELGVLHLATDPFGEKPLYLLHRPEGVYFCSEAGPLIRAFGLRFEPTEAQKADLLYLGYIRPPETGYHGLESVAQGQHITVGRHGEVKRRTYWYKPIPHMGRGKVEPLTEKDIDKVRDALCASLTLRLRSDVPLGLFLSGGVDSSLVAALAAKELGVSLNSFTVAFPDGKDESREAARIAAHFGLPHRIIDSAGNESWKDAPGALLDLYGVPNDNMTALAVHQMCVAAKAHLTVALSGLGGDELFYGYRKYETLYRRRALYRYGRMLKPLKLVPSPKFKNLAETITGQADRDFMQTKNGMALPRMEQLSALPPDVLPVSGNDLAFRVRDFDCDMSMPQSYIPAIDRGSMRAGVEVRTPFLSRTLWDLMSDMDQRALIGFGPKSVARRLLARYMPPELLTPGKQGFVFPAARYMQARQDAPVIPGWAADDVEAIWAKRMNGAFTQPALRLAVLERAYGR